MNDIERAKLEVYLAQKEAGLIKLIQGTFDGIRAHLMPAFPIPRDYEHGLKTWPEYFDGLWAGLKRAELRTLDRDFRVGDTLLLGEYVPERSYTGRWVRARIIRIDEMPNPGRLALLSLDFIARGDETHHERHPCALATEVAPDGATRERVAEL